MGTAFGRLAELLRVKIGQREMRPRFPGVGRQQFLHLIRGVGRIVSLLQSDREVEPGFDRERVDGQRVFISGQALRQIARLVRGHAQIVVRVEKRWIGLYCAAIRLDRVRQVILLLRVDALRQQTLGFAPMAGLPSRG